MRPAHMRNQTDRPKSIRLQALREERGLKRHEVAIELGVDPSTIWRWEATGPSMTADLTRLAQFYGVSVGYLMGWDEAA